MTFYLSSFGSRYILVSVHLDLPEENMYLILTLVPLLIKTEVKSVSLVSFKAKRQKRFLIKYYIKETFCDDDLGARSVKDIVSFLKAIVEILK